MEHFLFFSFGLSLVSFLCMYLTEPEVVVVPHAETDKNILPKEATRISLYNLSPGESQAIPLLANKLSNGTLVRPQVRKETQEQLVEAHAVTDFQFV